VEEAFSSSGQIFGPLIMGIYLAVPEKFVVVLEN
jgi:hypothetical protein